MTTPQHWMVPDEPMVYAVWRVDCPCGAVIDYGEDDASLPESCEGCGRPVPEPL